MFFVQHFLFCRLFYKSLGKHEPIRSTSPHHQQFHPSKMAQSHADPCWPPLCEMQVAMDANLRSFENHADARIACNNVKIDELTLMIQNLVRENEEIQQKKAVARTLYWTTDQDEDMKSVDGSPIDRRVEELLDNGEGTIMFKEQVSSDTLYSSSDSSSCLYYSAASTPRPSSPAPSTISNASVYSGPDSRDFLLPRVEELNEDTHQTYTLLTAHNFELDDTESVSVNVSRLLMRHRQLTKDYADLQCDSLVYSKTVAELKAENEELRQAKDNEARKYDKAVTEKIALLAKLQT